MKKNIAICFDFKGVGRGNISVFPGEDCAPYLQEEPGCKNFMLEEGNYLLRIEGTVSIANASVTIKDAGTEIAALTLPAGYFSRPLEFSI